MYAFELYACLKRMHHWPQTVKKTWAHHITGDFYLRKGYVPRYIVALLDEVLAGLPSFKYNHNHDPVNGQFTGDILGTGLPPDPPPLAPGSYPGSSITSQADAEKLITDANGQHIGTNEQCASLTHALAPQLPPTPQWMPGDKVQGNTDIPIGTPVATFAHIGEDGTNGYGPTGHPAGLSGESHTGIYLGQDDEGMSLLSQGPQIRIIPWGAWDKHPDEGGSVYYTIDY